MRGFARDSAGGDGSETLTTGMRHCDGPVNLTRGRAGRADELTVACDVAVLEVQVHDVRESGSRSHDRRVRHICERSAPNPSTIAATHRCNADCADRSPRNTRTITGQRNDNDPAAQQRRRRRLHKISFEIHRCSPRERASGACGATRTDARATSPSAAHSPSQSTLPAVPSSEGFSGWMVCGRFMQRSSRVRGNQIHPWCMCARA